MYEDAYERIQPGEEKEVEKEQERFRTEHERRIAETVARIYGKGFDPKTLSDTTKETNLDLAMDRRAYEHRKKLYEHNKMQTVSKRHAITER